jgi:NTP pyrophosphatase (non-canonical NTP hydrolase)
MELAEFINDCHRIAMEKGFWDGYPDQFTRWQPECINTKLLLIISEAVEAMEALRKNDITREDRVEEFSEEVADIIIRTADLAGALGIDLEEVIMQKREKNKKRAIRHGKRF